MDAQKDTVLDKSKIRKKVITNFLQFSKSAIELFPFVVFMKSVQIFCIVSRSKTNDFETCSGSFMEVNEIIVVLK